MKKINVKTIQHFLLDQDMYWNGVVFLDKDDTTSMKKVLLIINNQTVPKKFYLNIGLFKFEIYQEVLHSSYQENTTTREIFKDFSELWINYLIENNICHEEILKIVSNNKLILESEYDKEIATLKQKIVKVEKTKALKLQELNNIEKKIISKNDQLEKV